MVNRTLLISDLRSTATFRGDQFRGPWVDRQGVGQLSSKFALN
jgi:hypothetical protein